MRIETICSADDWITRLRKFKNDQPSVGPQNSEELAQRLGRVPDIANSERNRHDIGACIWQVKRGCVAFFVLHAQSCVRARSLALLASNLKHLRREVDTAH